jgi:hypothetical protein
MSLTTAANILSITTALGEAYTDLQATIDDGSPSSALSKLIAARQEIDTQQAESDFDEATAWMSDVRDNETSLENTINNALDEAVNACNTYYVSAQNSSFKSYWHGRSASYLVSFTTAFRNLWRLVRDEELCVLLSSKTKSGGVWQSTSTINTLGRETTLDLRAGSAIGGADITVTLTLVRGSGVVDVIVMTIPAGAALDTYYPINGSIEYLTITDISCTGGTNSDIVEVWVRP